MATKTVIVRSCVANYGHAEIVHIRLILDTCYYKVVGVNALDRTD